MVHTGLESIEIALRDLKEIQIVTKTDDHELKSFVPYLKLVKWSPYKPSDMRTIQAEKGMIVLGSGCEDCKCSLDDLTYSEGKKEGMKIVHNLYVTPINRAVENDNLTEWVKELKKRYGVADEAHSH